RGVLEDVAVEHPYARVPCEDRHVVALAGLDLQRVGPPRPHQAAVASENEHVMAVQVHRVCRTRMVGEAELDGLAAANHEHGHVRIRLAVDRPLAPEAQSSLEEAELPADVDAEAPVEVRRSGRGG